MGRMPGRDRDRVNFMCQLDWDVGFPVIGLNIFLGVSVRVFLGEISI